MLSSVVHTDVQVGSSVHPQFANVFSSMLSIFVDDVVYENDFNENNHSQMLPPEQKSVAFMNNFV